MKNEIKLRKYKVLLYHSLLSETTYKSISRNLDEDPMPP